MPSKFVKLFNDGFKENLLYKTDYCRMNNFLDYIAAKGYYKYIADVEFCNHNKFKFPGKTQRIKLKNIREISSLPIWNDEVFQFKAINITCLAIRYIKNPSVRVQFRAIDYGPNTIRHIRNPAFNVQIIAVCNNPKCIKYIKKPHINVSMFAMQVSGWISLRINTKVNLPLYFIRLHAEAGNIQFVLDRI